MPDNENNVPSNYDPDIDPNGTAPTVITQAPPEPVYYAGYEIIQVIDHYNEYYTYDG